MIRRTLTAFTAALALAAIAAFQAPASADSGFRFDESGSVDLAKFISKCEKIFFSGTFAEKHPEAAKVRMVLDKLGILSLVNYKFEFQMGDGRIDEKCVVALDPKKPNNFLAQLSRLPDAKINVGQIVNPSNALAQLSIMNPAEKLELIWNGMNDEDLWRELEAMPDGGSEIAQAKMGFGMADMMLKSMGGFEMLKGVIGDELTLLLLEFPEGDMTHPDYDWDATVAMAALAIDDMDALTKGDNAPLARLLSGEPAFTANGIKFYNVEGPIVAGIGKGFLVAGTNPARLKEIIQSSKPTVGAITAGTYMSIDVNTLWHKYFEPFTRSPYIPYPPEATAAHKEFFDITPQTNFGKLEMTWSCKPNEMTYTLHAREELANLFLMVYTWGLATAVSAESRYGGWEEPAEAAPEGLTEDQAMLESESENALYEIQQAVESYFVEHGEYPRYIEDAIGSFPYNPFADRPMEPRLPNDWAAGDFSYRPYMVDGVVTSYHLLLFGALKYGGMDVVTAMNAFEERQWMPASDGNPDGVILVLSAGTES
ncbi:MAG: hypothetical protein HRF49_10780 [bacterium]|jgi:hypothetical protein